MQLDYCTHIDRRAAGARVAVRQEPPVNSQGRAFVNRCWFGLAAVGGLACDDPNAVSDVPQRSFSGI